MAIHTDNNNNFLSIVPPSTRGTTEVVPPVLETCSLSPLKAAKHNPALPDDRGLFFAIPHPNLRPGPSFASRTPANALAWPREFGTRRDPTRWGPYPKGRPLHTPRSGDNSAPSE